MTSDDPESMRVSVRKVAGEWPTQPESPEKTAQVKVPIGPPLRRDKIRQPFTWVPMPPEFSPVLGQIALLWGQFEKYLNDMLTALLSYNGTPIQQFWQSRLSYKQRTELFLAESAKTFACNPFLYLHFRQIISDAEAIQIKRNVLLHGTIEMETHIHNTTDTGEIGEVVVESKIVATGARKRQTIEMKFGFSELEDLFYDLGHLAGRLSTLNPDHDTVPLNTPIVPGQKPPNRLPTLPYASWQDICLVQDLLRKHHPAHTNQSTPEDPPQSSPA
jgi:hypothetical protein